MNLKFLCETGKSVINLEETRFLAADAEVRKLNPDLADWLWSKRSISYERYWEIAISSLRKTIWTDTQGMDMLDGTEVKTARFAENKDGAFRATVGNVKNKTGAVVIVLFYPDFKEFDFLYIPANKVHKHTNNKGNSLAFTFPRNGEPSGWWVQYRTSLKQLINRE
jgi:hypothetical protein